MAKYYDRSWNPVFGCTGNFAGCDNCFAKSLMQKRNSTWHDFNEVKINTKQYYKKFDDNKHELISICTQSDLFQDKVKFGQINGVLRKCNNHRNNNYLILTKFSNNLKNYFRDNREGILNNNHINDFSFDNMIFGVSVCCNDDLARINDLKKAKLIKHRFIAFEPLLEDIEITQETLRGIDWVIVGCQTGGETKVYCSIDWITKIVELADAMNIPVFVNSIMLENGKITDELNEMPDFLKRN